MEKKKNADGFCYFLTFILVFPQKTKQNQEKPTDPKVQN